ncbi:biopolymer transporter ExbD [Bdellovibrio sp. ZAP7]|jgi:biopolymer transport protein ExbD|uniref:ExbD/TolR family protein n=1 Tax=Bdellovibrio sp. ZAP7 TaxID=2231053 RepID=UPI001157376F|nr:biopolymer transporter ExbD [Bdellovibrio sp. ZAP7]QDK45518.1 biopolymer transporter ExbD [Bdellovibrio sp. ZAP7]
MSASGNGNDKLNFEINILPILDILSVLICFLLLTAVWLQIGTLDTKQAIGDNSTAGAVNPPSLWVTMEADGSMQLSLRDVPKAKTLEERIARSTEGVDLQRLEARLQAYKAQWPDLKTSVVRPGAQTNYGDVIRVMDKLKQNSFEGVGLSPLG